MRFIIVFLFLNGLCSILLGQTQCIYLEFKITDLKSKDLIIIGSKDSLIKLKGDPLYITSRDSCLITDSISISNKKTKLHQNYIDIEFINYDGLKYVCYKDSVQLTVVDFTKNDSKLFLNNIVFCKDLELDTLLKNMNIDSSCISISNDWYYESYDKMYQVAFISKDFALSGFRFYFDYETKRLWYADLDFINTGGIFQRR